MGGIGTEIFGGDVQGVDVVYERVAQPVGNGVVGFAFFDKRPVFIRKIQRSDAR